MALYLIRMDHPQGDGWDRYVVEHVRYLKTLIDQGTLLESGPLKETPLRAGFLIMAADSQQQVEALIAADPFSREGLICQLRIEKWDPLFGILAEQSSQTLPPAAVSAELRYWACQPTAGGQPLGFWRSEIGELFQLLMLRAFSSEQVLQGARERVRLDRAPLGISATAVQLSMESYRPFPFLPLPSSQLATPANVYEFRTYRLKPGGLGPTLAGWEKAVPRASDYTGHLITTMYALDGPPRITYIWRFSSLEERARLRAAHYAAGLWPPEGGPQQIASAT